MKTKKLKLKTLNKIDDNFIDGFVAKDKGIIKVTTVSYYELYESNEAELERLGVEWFETKANGSHAYRDGSKLPWTNLVSVEVMKRDNK